MYTLLFVDDDPRLLRMSKAFLESIHHFTVLTMPSATEALEFLAAGHADAVVSDYQMPLMDGISFLKALRSRGDTTPFIIFTGKGREEVVVEAFNAGADAYIQKGGDPVAQFAELSRKTRDAIELRMTEHARKESEERYRTLFDDSVMGIFQTTPGGKYLAMNPAFAHTYGYGSPEEMQEAVTDIGQQLYVRPSDRQEIVRLLETEGIIRNFVTENRHRDGHSIWISINARAVRSPSDGQVSYEGTIEDITERKEAEAELDRIAWMLSPKDVPGEEYVLVSGETGTPGRHHEILDAVGKEQLGEIARDIVSLLGTSCTIFEKNGDPTLDLMSPRWCRALGDTPHAPAAWEIPPGTESSPMPLDTVIDGRVHIYTVPITAGDELAGSIRTVYWDPPNDESALTRLSSVSGVPADDLRRAVSQYRTRPPFIIELAKKRLDSEARRIATMVGWARAEQARKASEERFSRMAANSPDILYRMALPEGKYEFISPAVSAISGYDPEEFYRDPGVFMSFVHPDSIPYIKEMQERLFRGDVRQAYEYRIITRAGETKWVNQRNVLVTGDQGRPVAVEGIVTDITAWVVTENALKKSEERFRHISELISDIAYSCRNEPGSSFAINWMTGAVKRITGYSRDEVIAMTCWKALVIDEDIPVFERNVTGIPEGESARCELRIRCKDGSIAWLASFARCSPDPEKTGSCILYGGLQDITRRKRDEEALLRKTSDLEGINEELAATEEELRQNYENLTRSERALRESEEQYRRIVETSEEGIWEIDESLTTTFVNWRMGEMLGYPQSEMIGMQIASFIPEPELPAHRARMKQRREGANDQFEMRLIRRDGTLIWALISVTAKKGMNGEFKGSFAMISDITTRKLYENALRESEERYRTLAETARDFIYIIDRDDNVAYANDYCLKLLGKTPDEVIGRPRRELFPEPTASKQFTNLQQVILTGKPLRIENTVPIAGREIWQDTHLVPVRDARGAITSVLGISRDITRLKNVEKALRISNAKLNLMTSVIRHDIINQVSVLLGFISLARTETDDLLKKDEYLANARAAGERISRFITFTREYQQIGVKAPAWQDLHHLVGLAVSEAHVGDLAIQNDIPKGIQILADPLVLKAFYNLIDNAARYGGKITTVRFNAVLRDDDLVITCEDNGIGIATEEKDKIFERGYGRNTGLGLFLARDILAITEITLTETGEHGKGARFEMHVPWSAWKNEL